MQENGCLQYQLLWTTMRWNVFGGDENRNPPLHLKYNFFCNVILAPILTHSHIIIIVMIYKQKHNIHSLHTAINPYIPIAAPCRITMKETTHILSLSSLHTTTGTKISYKVVTKIEQNDALTGGIYGMITETIQLWINYFIQINNILGQTPKK